ncbi:unnamed protein product [Peniophora sp. CBMAI 1063]|nr:unnamed protein product [Peniophora sp. CBMAI 1063]
MQAPEQTASHGGSRLAAVVPESIVLVTFAGQTHGIVRNKLETEKDALASVRERFRELLGVPDTDIALQVRIEGDGGDEYCHFAGESWTSMARVAKYIRVAVEASRDIAARAQQKQMFLTRRPVTFPVKEEEDEKPPMEYINVDSDDEMDKGEDTDEEADETTPSDEVADEAPITSAGGASSDIGGKRTRTSAQRYPSRRTRTLTLTEHRQIEENWLKTHRHGTPWIAPPVHLHQSLLERLGADKQKRLSMHILPDDVEIEIGGCPTKRSWISRRINSVGPINDRTILTQCKELHEALVRAHVQTGRHIGPTATRRKLRNRHVLVPELPFIEYWISKCPGC